MPDKTSLRFLLNSWCFNANTLWLMLITTSHWQWADPLNAEPLTFNTYINYVIYRFHFLSSQSLSHAPPNSAHPLAPYTLSSLHRAASPIPWPSLLLYTPSTNWKPLPCWFQRPRIQNPLANSGQMKEGWLGDTRASGSKDPNMGVFGSVTWWNQQQEWLRSMEAERGSSNSRFPTWILTPVPTAALRGPFSACFSFSFWKI